MCPEKFKHYKLGIPEIDEEHWELFMILEGLRIAVVARDSHTTSKILDIFFEKLNDHCVNEEKLMEKIQFNFIDAHKDQHPESSLYISNIKALHKNGEKPVIDVNRMVDALRDHIDYGDMQYVEAYNKWKSLT